MNLLITGGCGFIASNFIDMMINKYPNYTYVNLDCLDYCSNLSRLTKTNNYTFIEGNIQDSNLVTKILDQYKITVIVHFAAQSHVDKSFTNQMDYINTNIIGTYTLLECAHKYGKVERFINVSTDEVYGDTSIIKDENSLLNPNNPYSASKASAEMLCKAYSKSFKLPIIITRGNNVYGPKQYYDKVIPRFIHLLKNDVKCTIHGDGSNLRSFLHVEDVVAAFDIIIHKGVIGETYNIGTEKEVNILEVAKKCIQHMKPDSTIDDYITFVPDRPYNDKSYPIDSTKLNKLGWESKIPFDEGLKSTIEWYSNVNDDYWVNSL
ncbi:MAG: dTDP-glucose 4,6-dehydratase [Nitrososphaerales archaeon]